MKVFQSVVTLAALLFVGVVVADTQPVEALGLTFPPPNGGFTNAAPVPQPYAYYPVNPSVPYTPYAQQGGNPYPLRPLVPPQSQQKTVKPWGDTRYIWPDFYTDFTSDMWDKMINAPYDMGYMPGGWRFPSFSSPDPVTVGDAVTNQFPPIMEEAGNFVHFTQ